MRKKKFYKKHKIAIILGLLAAANLSIIGFATFGVSDTIVLVPDVEVNVEEVSQTFIFTSMTFTPFKLHTDGFYDEDTKVINDTAILLIETTYINTMPAGTNFEISLHNKSNVTKFDFFDCLSTIKLKVGSYDKTNSFTTYINKTLTYSDISDATLGIKNVSTGSLNFEFTFELSQESYADFYTTIFENIHGLVFTLSMKSMG